MNNTLSELYIVYKCPKTHTSNIAQVFDKNMRSLEIKVPSLKKIGLSSFGKISKFCIFEFLFELDTIEMKSRSPEALE